MSVLPSPAWSDGRITLYEGDAYELAPLIRKEYGVDSLVSDPPYGVGNQCDYTRFSGGVPHASKKWKQIEGDDRPFDPTPFLDFKNVVLWGANHFSRDLPQGSWLVWSKRRPAKLGKFMSDCELAWINKGRGVYQFNLVWDGFDRGAERGVSLHPSQKPVALMRWCIEKCKEPSVILDPFAGSGATLEAAFQMGLSAIGVEKEPEYLDTIIGRFSQGVLL